MLNSLRFTVVFLLLIFSREFLTLTVEGESHAITLQEHGVLVHQRENKFAGGVNTAVLQLRQVSFDAVFENTDFLPREESANQPEQAQDDII
jgi:hypothetical protein